MEKPLKVACCHIPALPEMPSLKYTFTTHGCPRSLAGPLQSVPCPAPLHLFPHHTTPSPPPEPIQGLYHHPTACIPLYPSARHLATANCLVTSFLTSAHPAQEATSATILVHHRHQHTSQRKRRLGCQHHTPSGAHPAIFVLSPARSEFGRV